MFDFFGGKTIATHSAALLGGAMLERFRVRGKLKKNKTEIKALEQELESLKNEQGTRKGREIARIAVLKKLAWKDGVLHNSERIYIYRYIMTCLEIDSDLMIEAMLDLDAPPTIVKDFWSVFERNYKNKLCSNDDEIRGFREVLIELSEEDGSRDKSETEYLNSVLKSCGLERLGE